MADSARMVTASRDGTLRLWNIAVRYKQQEDPKCLLSVRQPLPGKKCYERLSIAGNGIIAAACGTILHFLDSTTGA